MQDQIGVLPKNWSICYESLAIKLAIDDVSCGPESSLGVSTPEEGKTKKAQEIPGFVAICQFLSSGGFINFEAKRIFIVDSSKTEHHRRRAIRAIPLLPQMETELLKLHWEAEDGAEYVFPGLRADTNLRTTLEKIIRKAGARQWPKLWHNLRASGATDFARTLPSHVAAEICGHTEEIAKEHYWQVGQSDLDLAIAKLGSPKVSPRRWLERS